MTQFITTRNRFSLASLYNVRGVFSVLCAATEFLGGSETSAAELSDKELAQRMNDGDDRAFEELYNRYFEKIYAYTVRRVSHHEIAEDLVSKVFMKAFANRKRFVWKVSFSAWIYRIATNTITDYYRTKKSDVEFDPAFHDKPEADTAAPREVDRQILGKELERVLDKLKERDRTVLTLKFYSQMSNGEIADVVDCKPEHVAVLAHRALKKCQKLASEELLAIK